MRIWELTHISLNNLDLNCNHPAKIARRIEIAKPKKRIFKKKLSLDGCGIAEECLTLPRAKTVPIRNKGFCTNSLNPLLSESVDNMTALYVDLTAAHLEKASE